MDPIESWARKYACRNGNPLLRAPMRELMDAHTLSPIGSGAFARVYRISDTPWVLKESRWDIALPIIDGVSVNIPGQVFELKNIIPPLGTIQPMEENILREFGDYREFAKYAGHMDTSDEALREILGADLIDVQIALRRSLEERVSALEEKYSFTFAHTALLAALSVREHDFLPKEFLLYGDSISPENEGKQTSYILQEYITGRMLHDVPVRSLSDEARAQLLLFCLLLLLMNMESGILPDTRPRSVLFEAYDWLTNTDNIVVADRGLTFVDTRWFWHTDGKWWQSGFVVPQLMIYQCKRRLAGEE